MSCEALEVFERALEIRHDHQRSPLAISDQLFKEFFIEDEGEQWTAYQIVLTALRSTREEDRAIEEERHAEEERQRELDDLWHERREERT